MSKVSVGERVERVAATCASGDRDRGRLTLALSDLARIESWASARRAQLVSALAEQPGAFPEADIADTTGCTLGAATRETERANTLNDADAFADALDSGDIRPGHVDALTAATKDLTDEQAATLLSEQDELADRAAQLSIKDFQSHLRRRKRALQTEADREARLERQRANTRLRSWVDQTDGMWNLRGRFDPQTGARLQRLIDDTVNSLFADATPDTAPNDRLELQQHLNALALVQLLDGNTTGRTRPGDPIVIVDPTTADTTTGQPLVDWGLPIELPWSVLRDVFDAHDPDTVVVANGIILHAPGKLNLGRSSRLANRAQRRALAALYATCAIPGCHVHYDQCRLHHIIWWRHGGETNLDNLLPVCTHHHTRIHQDGWEVAMGSNRELTIRIPNGQVLRNSPPKRSAA